MNETVYGYAPAQRRAVRASALLLGAWASAVTLYSGVLASDHRTADAIGTWAVLGLAPALLSALVTALARGTTRIDDQGIRTSSAGRHRHCSWADVQDVETTTETGRGNHTTRIRIRLSDGRAFKLPAPYDSQTTGGDPDFERKLAQIRKQWRTGRKAALRNT